MAGCPQAVQISITTVVEVASGKGINCTYKRQKFNSCYDFGVYAYLASLTAAALAVGMRMRYLAISDSGEDLSTYLLVCDKLVNQCAACSGSPHNDKSSH